MTVPIVVVDDEEVDRYIVKRIVEKSDLDCKVVEYPTGEGFLEVITNEELREREIATVPPPILVLLDINMPSMTGFEVLESIQKTLDLDGHSSDFLVVLMFSSSSHAEDKKEAFSYPFVKDYIVKPLTVPVIQLMVETYCSDGA